MQLIHKIVRNIVTFLSYTRLRNSDTFLEEIKI